MGVAYISGHLDITEQEFAEHYKPKIEEALQNRDTFIVGDAKGTDAMAQSYLFERSPWVVVYHMFDKPRNNISGYATMGGYESDEERDSAMTRASSYDIAWVRPGREKSGTAKNLERRKNVQN